MDSSNPSEKRPTAASRAARLLRRACLATGFRRQAAGDTGALREILARIPHREPFLFVERVLERSERAILTEWTVPADSWFLRGHYPRNPILPGVIASEFVFQSAALLVCHPDSEAARDGALPVLTSIREARFKRIVRPGQTIRAHVALEQRLGPAHYMRARVTTAAGETVLRLEFVVALGGAEG